MALDFNSVLIHSVPFHLIPLLFFPTALRSEASYGDLVLDVHKSIDSSLDLDLYAYQAEKGISLET